MAIDARYVDQGMQPGAAATRAIFDVEDAIESEKFGAVKRGNPARHQAPARARGGRGAAIVASIVGGAR